jgi:hypothetical protein
MKRSTLFILIALVLLTALAVYLVRSGSGLSTVNKADRDFMVKDTAQITKVFFADKEGNSAEITREKGGWMVNKKYFCRSEAILNVFEAIRLMEVKMPVPKAAKDNVIRFMSSNAVKVEIYAGDEKIKQYYIGHEPADSEGSYMILSKDDEENYPDPYVVFIPGFKGYLQPRFITRENEWRDRVVLNYTPPQLKEIRVSYFDQAKDSSFAIEFLDQNNFKLKNKEGRELAFDMGKMRQYLIYFQNISYESLLTAKSSRILDSLNRSSPFAILEVITKEQTNTYRFFRKAYSGKVNPELGVEFPYDPDRLFLNFDNKKEWALVQYFVFGKLLITSSYFLAPASVKK